jgi:hypothetical protein
MINTGEDKQVVSIYVVKAETELTSMVIYGTENPSGEVSPYTIYHPSWWARVNQHTHAHQSLWLMRGQ